MKKSIQSFFLKFYISNNLKIRKKEKIKAFYSFDKTKKIGILFNGFKRENTLLVKELIKYFSEKKNIM